MTANGIDVSNHNGFLDLTHGLTGLDFVIAKCTERTNFSDPTYTHYHTQAHSLGLHFGAYHFLHAEDINGQEEALFFLRHANLGSGDSVWVDYETFGTNGDVDAEVIALFAETIQAESPVPVVGLYSNLNGFHRVLEHNVMQAVGPLWLAFPNNQTETPTHPLSPFSWTIHQYEQFNGIDRDYSRISAHDLTNLFIHHLCLPTA